MLVDWSVQNFFHKNTLYFQDKIFYGTNRAVIKSAEVWQNKDEEHSCEIIKPRDEKLLYTLFEQTIWQSKEALRQELIFV
jgi:hypothetical protein